MKSVYFIELLLCLFCLRFDQVEAQILRHGVEGDGARQHVVEDVSEPFEINIYAGEGYRMNRMLFGCLLVLPPWLQTWSAYLCCILIGGGLVFLYIRLRQIRGLGKEREFYEAKIDTVTSQDRSEEQEGQTCLSVGFLAGSSHYSSDRFGKSETVFTDHAGIDAGTIYGPGISAPAGKKFTVLLIEDDDKLRALESELLSENYHVLEAVNGFDGLKMAFENIPDLILCDVILPVQNGIQVCGQLKADIRTSHIPIILLTGQSALPQVIQGLQAGADDYLVQPVDMNILLLKIQNLIKTRTAIHDHTEKALSSGTDEWLSAGANDEFIDKLRGLVIENISQPNFGVNEMAFQVGMSVSVLYRKVRSLTGMTVNDFMKTIKMQKALQLLESGAYQVNEVALMVGYESVRYFSNEFKKLYGKNPSKFRSQPGESGGSMKNFCL